MPISSLVACRLRLGSLVKIVSIALHDDVTRDLARASKFNEQKIYPILVHWALRYAIDRIRDAFPDRSCKSEEHVWEGEVSSLRASIPSAVYVVTRSVGEYSDRTETPVCAFFEEECAKSFVVSAAQQWREAVQIYPRIEWPKNYQDEAVYKVFSAKRKERADKVRSWMTLDPDAGPYEFDDEEPYYYYFTVPLHAIGMPCGHEDAKRLSGEAVAAQPEGIAQ